MADEATVSSASNNTPAQPKFDNRDWLLDEFIRLAELGIEHGVTLFVGGAIMTGTVISAEKYFNAMAEDLESATVSGSGEPSILKHVQDNYRSFAREVAVPADEPEGYKRKTSLYVHLNDAKAIVAGHHIPMNRGFLWRGKLTSVDGFFAGQISEG